jgi:dTDP-4-dehydrorhamnose reductase
MFVTGAAGMVGGYVPHVFGDCELVLTDLIGGTALDVRDRHAVVRAVRDARPDVVLHLAAATDVDRCQTEREWARESNAAGTRYVAEAARDVDAVLVYVSTGSVFSGDKADDYVESDVPGPVNIYAATKLEGERIVAATLSRFFIVRAGWMIGGGAVDSKFVGKMVSLIAEGRTTLRAVSDTRGTPTYAKDLLAGIRRLLPTGRYGLYHLGNAGSCTRYDVACAVVDALGRKDVNVQAVDSSLFPLPAPRPRSEAIRNAALQALGMEQRPWRDALHEYVTSELAARLTRS